METQKTELHEEDPNMGQDYFFRMAVDDDMDTGYFQSQFVNDDMAWYKSSHHTLIKLN